MELLETRIKGKKDILFMIHSICKLSEKEKLYKRTRVKLRTFIQDSSLFKHALEGMLDFFEKEGLEQLFEIIRADIDPEFRKSLSDKDFRDNMDHF